MEDNQTRNYIVQGVAAAFVAAIFWIWLNGY
jgi:hypothetical protein